ncbi:MAG: hypothetical protein ACKV22_23870 [Bryobacteraceae bacterium]
MLLALDGLPVFLYAASLIWPVSQTKYLDAWSSIESTFIADGRFLAENWPRPLWQPNWYCGTRFNYVYPPALRYGTAVLTRSYPMPAARAYHIYISILYAAGILGVFLLARLASGSRLAGWMAALGTVWLSPIHLLVADLRDDTADYVTQRLKALVLYGEGPHISSLAILPFALAAGFFALRNRSLAALGWAAVLSALVVAHNFYGGLALAMSFPFVVWSVWVTGRERSVWLRAAAIGLLAYGLSACWLGPSYLRVTLNNLRLVAQPGNAWSPAVAAVFLAVYGILTWRWASRKQERAYVVFLAGVLGYFSIDTLGNHYLQYRIAGEPSRLFPEWDMYLSLAGAEALRRVAGGGGWKRTTAAFILFVAAVLPAKSYIFHPWRLMTRYDPYQERVEYRMQDWVNRNLPGSRVLAAGSVRFWYNAWHDLPQLGGGSEQGVSNQLVVTAQFRILQEPEPEQPILWAQAYGLDAFIINEAESGEMYHDWVKPRQFAGRLAVLWDDGKGSVIYDIPRRYRSLARVVDRKGMDALKPMTLEGDIDTIRAYVDLMERGPDARTVTRWQGDGRLLIEAPVSAEQSLVVQVSYDPQWRAWADGKAAPVRKNVVGHVVVDAPPGARQVLLVFEAPLEDRIGLALTFLSALAALWLIIRRPPA